MGGGDEDYLERGLEDESKVVVLFVICKLCCCDYFCVQELFTNEIQF